MQIIDEPDLPVGEITKDGLIVTTNDGMLSGDQDETHTTVLAIMSKNIAVTV